MRFFMQTEEENPRRVLNKDISPSRMPAHRLPEDAGLTATEQLCQGQTIRAFKTNRPGGHRYSFLSPYGGETSTRWIHSPRPPAAHPRRTPWYRWEICVIFGGGHFCLWPAWQSQRSILSISRSVDCQGRSSQGGAYKPLPFSSCGRGLALRTSRRGGAARCLGYEAPPDLCLCLRTWIFSR